MLALQRLPQASFPRTHRKCLCNAAKDSAGFSNNLRKGFQPQKKPPPKPPAAPNIQTPNIQTLGLDGDQTEDAWRKVDEKVTMMPLRFLRRYASICSGCHEQ
jgi:hypothetical protein